MLGRVGYACLTVTLAFTVTGGGLGLRLDPEQDTISSAAAAAFRRRAASGPVGRRHEYAIDNNWSIRAEYRYSNLGYFYDGTIIYPNVFQKDNWTLNDVQIGFSYKWPAAGPAAVVAKY